MQTKVNKWFKRKTITMWSHSAADLLPKRSLIIIAIVMPIVYLLLFLFGLTTILVSPPAFSIMENTIFGTIWAALLSLFAFVSFVGLMFRLRIEIYSSIILTILLFLYWLFVVITIFTEPTASNLERLGSIFSLLIHPTIVAWRVFDLTIEIRKSRQRQLYAEASLGGQ